MFSDRSHGYRTNRGAYTTCKTIRRWKDVSWFIEGDIVNYSIQSLPGESFHGAISYVDPIINSVTRVAQARIEVSNNN